MSVGFWNGWRRRGMLGRRELLSIRSNIVLEFFFGGRFVFEGIDSTRTVHISSHVQKEASLVVMMQVKVNKGTEARKQKDINNWRNPYDKASGPGFPLFVTCAHSTRRPCLGLTGKS